MRTTFLIALIGVLSGFALGQDASKWEEMVTAKGDLRVSLPQVLIVFNHGDSFSLNGSLNGIAFDVAKRQIKDPRTHVSEMDFKDPKPTATQEFAIGEFLIEHFEYEGPNGFAAYLYAGSKSSYYELSVRAKRKDESVLRFLNSIEIEGKPLFGKNVRTAIDPSSVRIIEKLKSSQIVNAALKKNCTGEMRFGYAKDADQKFVDDKVYSRQLIFLERPRMRREGYYEGVRGSVRLRILFGADGCAASAIVLSKADKTNTHSALRAAAKIKFVPAEVAGKPVDSYRTVEYVF